MKTPISTLIQLLNQQLETEFDVDATRQAAEAHSILALLYRTLKANAKAPPALYAASKVRYFKNNLWALHNMQFLAEFQSLLQKEDIPFLVLKGPLLSYKLYQDLGLRHSVDIDILIAPEHFYKTHMALTLLGFSPRDFTTLPADYTKLIIKTWKSMPYLAPQKNLSLDIHWRLEHRSQPFNIAQEHQSVTLPSGQHFLTLPPLEEWLYLCTHGSRHAWKKLQWLCDIIYYLPLLKQQDVPFSAIFAKAREYKIENSVNLALQLGKLFFPKQISGPSRESSAFLINTCLQHIEGSTESPIKRHCRLKWFSLVLTGSWRKKLRLLLNPVRERFLVYWIKFSFPRQLFFISYFLYLFSLGFVTINLFSKRKISLSED